METQCVGSKLREEKCHQSLRLFHRASALSIRIYAVLYTVKGRMHRRSRYRSGDGEGCSFVSQRSIWLRCEDDWVMC